MSTDKLANRTSDTNHCNQTLRQGATPIILTDDQINPTSQQIENTKTCRYTVMANLTTGRRIRIVRYVK